MWIIFLLAEYPEVELGLTHTTAETLRSHVEGLVGGSTGSLPLFDEFLVELNQVVLGEL